MSEVNYAISIIKGKLKNADKRNLNNQRFSIADMEAILGVLSKSESEYAVLHQKLDAISAKSLELCSEAAHVYQKYNVTQMPDRDLLDHQTIQELSDLIRSGTHDTADKEAK